MVVAYYVYEIRLNKLGLIDHGPHVPITRNQIKTFKNKVKKGTHGMYRVVITKVKNYTQDWEGTQWSEDILGD